MSSTQADNDITWKDIYPTLTPAQQAEAEYYLARYLEIVQGIFERLERQNLTASQEPGYHVHGNQS